MSADPLADKVRLGGHDARTDAGSERRSPLPERLDVDPDSAEHGLAALVLTLVDVLRQVLERQAVRRMEGGTLTDEEVERLGQTFMRLAERMEELKEVFDLDDEDLDLDLDFLGDLRDLL